MPVQNTSPLKSMLLALICLLLWTTQLLIETDDIYTSKMQLILNYYLVNQENFMEIKEGICSIFSSHVSI